MVEMIYQIRPEYRKLIKYLRSKSEHFRKMLIGKITKVIYGTLFGVIQFYKKLWGVLTDLDSQTNEYDECTFNKMNNGSQCKIQVQVNDLKLS